MEIKQGQVVTSRKGRDVGCVYVVLGTENDRVVLCDGHKRTLNAPKKKNALHLQPTNTLLQENAIESDLSIKMALKEYVKNQKAQMQGG